MEKPELCFLVPKCVKSYLKKTFRMNVFVLFKNIYFRKNINFIKKQVHVFFHLISCVFETKYKKR